MFLQKKTPSRKPRLRLRAYDKVGIVELISYGTGRYESLVAFEHRASSRQHVQSLFRTVLMILLYGTVRDLEPFHCTRTSTVPFHSSTAAFQMKI